MQVKEVAALAALNLGRDDLRSELKTLEESDTLSDELQTLLKCYNLVENEIALEYFPLTAYETLTSHEGKVAFSFFSHAPVNIRSVETERGESLTFRLFPTHIAVKGEDMPLKITYNYTPETKGIFDSCVFTERVSARLMAYGMASEFMLMNARYSEADMWRNRYKEALARAGILCRRLSVKSRRWV